MRVSPMTETLLFFSPFAVVALVMGAALAWHLYELHKSDRREREEYEYENKGMPD